MKANLSEEAFEFKHLEQVISIAQGQLHSAKRSSQKKKADAISSMKEVRENSAHSVSNPWNMDNFHEFVAMAQYTGPLSGKISEYDSEMNRILSLERLIDSPYFARIDFQFDGEEDPEKIYIGRSTLMDEKSYKMHVYDWRSPIASVFYRFGTGKAFYEAPSGKITGEVYLKRQYEIAKGKLEYFFDADVQIVDEFLRKLLSQNASSKMKTIVETIQRDQDIIIRDMEMDLMMVQGVAGSGKTSVALHRVAYLMYQGLSTRLFSNNIIVISPNTLFEQYISNVLPALGEGDVNSVIFEDILRTVLQVENIQDRNRLLECLLTSDDKQFKDIRKSSMIFKSSRQFIDILDRFIHDLPKRWIEFSDVYYNGEYIASRQLLKAKLLADKKPSLLSRRLKKLEQTILDQVHKLRVNRIHKLEEFLAEDSAHFFEVKEAARMLSIYESTALIKQIRKFTELNFRDLYKRLFRNKDYFYSLARGIKLPDCIEDIRRLTCENLDGDRLHYEDALAVAFLKLRLEGYTEYKDIKQVVVDEAQDYTPLHFKILSLLFPKARYTVLGDINQTVEKQEDLSLYDQFGKILNKKKSTLITMDKSFRCTKEILEYSTKFLEQGFKINSFSRNGDVPAVYAARCVSDLDDRFINEINYCREKNYQSIGLICKTEKDATALHKRLKDKVDLKLIKSDSNEDLRGTFIIPVYLSKGLEFDAVLIIDTDKEHYSSGDDRKLLYIACTRALHRLNLFYTGDISPLL